MRFIRYLVIGSALLTAATINLPAQATCIRVLPYIDAGGDTWGVGTGLGRINLTNTYLQPVGTPLGSSVISFTSAARYPDPNKVLYECDASDASQIFEEFATNGDDRVGGFNEVGTKDGYPDYYATWFPYVAIRLTHLNSGKPFTRNWQTYPITHYAKVGDKIQIRVKELSLVRADLIKVSTPTTTAWASNWCPLDPPLNTSVNYTCPQPNGYVLFMGPGIDAETPGSDSAYAWGTFGTGRWNAIGMGTAPVSSISYTASCVARNVTPLVVLPPISVSQLSAGQTSQAQFTINIECDNAAVSGIGSNNTALGLQVPDDSYRIAQQLGLVNASGGVSYLLSSGYGTDSTVATGVGITLSNATSGSPMNFLGWNPCNLTTSQCPQGNSAGWYPVLDGASSVSSSQSGFTHYTTQIMATLTRLPGQTVTAGKVDAKAYVWVKVQ